MRSYRANHNLVAVSASAKETAINTEQTLSTSMLVDIESVGNIEPRREDNANELTGKEEPDTIYDLGGLSMLGLTFSKAQPQHFAFIMAYALGQIATAPAGAGYQHTITPIVNDLDESRSNPSFTVGQRYGLTVLKRRYASMFIDNFTASFNKDSWVSLNAQAKGTGKVTNNVVEEEISAAENAVSLTLAANGVEGSTALARLDNIQRIRCELTPGVWTEVSYSAVSAATPAAITISAPGSTTDVKTYKVLYIPTETGWMTFPARVVETPLRVSQMSCNLGGTWNGTAFTGGRTLAAEIRGVEWNFSNNFEIEFVPGAGDAYASRCFRPGRTQTIKLNREFRNYILQQHIASNDTFGFYILASGAAIDGTNNYQVELIFPKVGVLTAPISIDGKRLGEAGDLQVLEHDTYGSVIARVKNLVSAYAA